jgi:hypothetical protein
MHQLEILGASLLLKLLVTDLWTLLWTIMVIEILGASLLLKLLVTDLWTLLWTIMFIHPMWESSSFLFLLTCSVLDVKSHLSRQHILNQLETAVLDSTHSMYQLEILGASLLLKLLVTDLALNTLFRDWCSLDFDVVVW